MKNKKHLFMYSLILSIFFIFFLATTVYASTPRLISKINEAFENIERWLINLATPAAAVAVGSGIFMKKFSFGDEEKIKTGKKIIRGSLFSYGFILATDLILSTIKSLIT
ncbi:MAG: hypothetical protein HFJ48_05410 [Clostridia bacterium]|nr:hypothetical protein [Clostridia bacterium]